MLRTADERSVMLQDYVETIMEGLQAVANILAVKKVYSFAPPTYFIRCYIWFTLDLMFWGKQIQLFIVYVFNKSL